MTSTFTQRFAAFYSDVFLPEHQVRANVALHVFATLLSAALLVWAAFSPYPWAALAYPIVHAVPGLIGHRLFERSGAVGDVRITRTDYPLWWFIIANHRLTWEVLTGTRANRRTQTS
jgi:hypothetical protein